MLYVIGYGISSANTSYLFKLKQNGQGLWAKTHPDRLAQDIEIANDGIFILMNNYSNYQQDLMKLDTAGTAIWHKTYSGSWIDFSQEVNNRLEILSDSTIVFLNSSDYGNSITKVDSTGESISGIIFQLKSRDVLESVDNGVLIMGNGPVYGVKIQYEEHIGIVYLDSLLTGDCTSSISPPVTVDDSVASTTLPMIESGSISQVTIPLIINGNTLLQGQTCVDYISGLDEESQLSMNVYPTISNGIFFVEWEQEESIELSVYDSKGQLIARNKPPGNGTEIDLSNNPAGIYLYTVRNELGQQASGKIIKQ